MPSTDLLLLFFSASLVFAYIPGPALLYAAAQTVAGGRAAGLMAALGLHIGGYVHVVAAAAGLSVLFHAVPSLYLAVKLLGAVYLVFLGGRMLLQAFRKKTAITDSINVSKKSRRRAFVESIAVEVLNPKTAVFFVAFLPQFVDPAATFPIWVQFIVLGSIVNVMFSSADLVCVFFAGIVVDKLRQSNRLAKVMEGVGGGVLIGLGANLALQRH